MLAANNMTVTAEDMTNRGRADLVVVLPKAVYIFELQNGSTCCGGARADYKKKLHRKIRESWTKNVSCGDGIKQRRQGGQRFAVPAV